MGVSAELQRVLRAAMTADLEVAAKVGDRIYDGNPPTAVHPYITFGPTDLRPEAEADCLVMREETFQIDIWDRSAGQRQPCADIVDAVVKALRSHQADLGDGVGSLIDTVVELARVVPDRDDITRHGIVQVTCLVEEDG